MCSHHRSYQLWTASLLLAADSTAFSSVQSDSWSAFQLGNIDTTRVASLGINCPRE